MKPSSFNKVILFGLVSLMILSHFIFWDSQRQTSPDNLNSCVQRPHQRYFLGKNETMGPKKTVPLMSNALSLNYHQIPPTLTLDVDAQKESSVSLLYQQRHGGLAMDLFCHWSMLFPRDSALFFWHLLSKFLAFSLFLFLCLRHFGHQTTFLTGLFLIVNPLFQYGFMSDIVEIYSLVCVLVFSTLFNKGYHKTAFCLLGLSLYIRLNSLWYFPLIFIFSSYKDIYDITRNNWKILLTCFLVFPLLYLSLLNPFLFFDEVKTVHFEPLSYFIELFQNILWPFAYLNNIAKPEGHYIQNISYAFLLIFPIVTALIDRNVGPAKKIATNILLPLGLSFIICLLATRKNYPWIYLSFLVYPLALSWARVATQQAKKKVNKKIILFFLMLNFASFSLADFKLQAQYDAKLFNKTLQSLLFSPNQKTYAISMSTFMSLKFIDKNNELDLTELFSEFHSGHITKFADVFASLKGTGRFIIIDNNYTAKWHTLFGPLGDIEQFRSRLKSRGIFVKHIKRLGEEKTGYLYIFHFEKN